MDDFPRGLFESFGVEAGQRVVLDGVTDLDRLATDFAVLHIALPANRQVENHRNFFAAIRAREGMFHRGSIRVLLQRVFVVSRLGRCADRR